MLTLHPVLRCYLVALSLIPLTACSAEREPTSTSPVTASVPVIATPTTDNSSSLSKCSDEYLRTPSPPTWIPWGAELDPYAVYTPTINITRANYEAALAKWQAQNISEYEIAVSEVSLDGHGRILRVEKGNVTVVGYFYSGTPVVETIPTAGVASERDLVNTVDGLFKRVKNILTYGICPGRGTTEFAADYEIEFDEKLGYPSKINRTGRDSGDVHHFYWIDIVRFKIIKQGVLPGVPGTGQTSP